MEDLPRQEGGRDRRGQHGGTVLYPAFPVNNRTGTGTLVLLRGAWDNTLLPALLFYKTAYHQRTASVPCIQRRTHLPSPPILLHFYYAI